MMLADMGAEVIKIESPDSPDETRRWGPFFGEESTYYLSVNRNKQSLTLNLKSPEGKEIFHRLVETADVVIENFRTGTMEKLGLGYAELTKINPRLIYCAVSGFGRTGPYRDRPGYDLLAQAMGGVLATTGEPGRPPVKVGMSIADIGSGMFAAIGILSALHGREKTGHGQFVETSLLETILSWQTYLATAYWMTGKVASQMGSAHPTIVPYQALTTQDGYIAVAAATEELWRAFCRAIDRQDLCDHPDYLTNRHRIQHREPLIRLLEEHLKTAPSTYWMERFSSHGVPASPIYQLDQIWNDPQVLARQMRLRVPHPRYGTMDLPGFPIKFSETPCEIHSPPPGLGDHSIEILEELGYSLERIQTLLASRITSTTKVPVTNS